jgi:hypothetical protein
MSILSRFFIWLTMPSKSYVLAMLEKHYRANEATLLIFEKAMQKRIISLQAAEVSYDIHFQDLQPSLKLACAYHGITEYKGVKI